jgi:DNA-binding MarR family transcriptional regulator
VAFDVRGGELVLLRQMACQPPRLRHVAVEWLAATLRVTPQQAQAVMERLEADGLATCHRDADDGRVCCASPTELGLAAAASSDYAQLRLI